MEPKQRPTFLTVLCILSFIAIGFGILSNLASLAMTPSVEEMYESQEMMEDMMSETEDGPMGGFLSTIMSQSMDAMEHQTTLITIAFIGLILCLVGVILMWRMKKSGYIPYVIGNLGPPIASIVLVGFMGGLALMGLFFPILFVVLYGLNLKHMS